MKPAIALVVFFAASSALGCPLCNSPTGEAVRAGIFNSSFASTFTQVIAPFLLIGVLYYAFQRFLPE
jgi:hypothetical protein